MVEKEEEGRRRCWIFKWQLKAIGDQCCKADFQIDSRGADWDGFRTELESIINLKLPLKSPEQLEKKVNLFITDLQQAAWNNT